VRYLFDTDHISILQRRSGPEFATLAARVRGQSPADLAYSVVSFHEQVLGAHNFISRARTTLDVVRGYVLLAENLRAFAHAPILPFDATAAAVYDDLRAQRVRIATMDLRIAAITPSRGLILLTRNTRDFGKVPGLVTEDWTK
jgi:tRNA(fMet)-specific endonuclease VapC